MIVGNGQTDNVLRSSLMRGEELYRTLRKFYIAMSLRWSFRT